MPRTSVTSELTTNVVNELNAPNLAIDSCIASGNTVKIKLASGFEFAFSARTVGGIAIGETKYSKESCIAGLAEFIAETGIQSSSKYDSWAKTPENKERKIPNTHAVMLTLGVWPAQTVTRLMLTGKLNEIQPDDIIAMQTAYNDKQKAKKPIKAEKKNDEVEVTSDSTNTATE